MSEVFEANAFPLTPGLRLLEASAGTGKTFALAHLVLRLLTEARLELRQLLVVTFTEAAAAELRDRIGLRLQQALRGLEDPQAAAPDPVLAAWLERMAARRDALRPPLLLAMEELDSADITTIHGFCRRTLARQALEASQPPELQLDPAGAVLVRQIVNDYWQQQLLPLPAHLLDGVQQRLKGPAALEPLLLALDGDPALQLAPLPAGVEAEAPIAPQLQRCWRQGWQRFADLWDQQGRDLEAAFCAAAAQWRQLGARSTTPYSPRPRKDRCAELEAWIAQQPAGGDHGAAASQELLRGYFHPGTFVRLASSLESAGEPSLPQRSLLEAIAWLVDGPAELVLLHACHWGRQQLRRRRQASGVLGFAQLLEALDPGALPTTPLLEAVGQRYGAALIDEFQDTDPIQWRILRTAFDPDRHRLVLVGDPKQAIYRFRGGELATYQRARCQAEAAAGISELRVNFRATETLLDALNRLMQPGLVRSGLPVPAVHSGADRQPLEALQGESPLQLLWLGGDRAAGDRPPSRSALEQRVAPLIARHTAALLQRGVPARDVCLLVHTHRQAEQLRRELARCGIASRLVSRGDVFASAAATALQRFLDALAEPGRSERLRLLATSPLLGWSAARLAATTPRQWGALAARLAQLADQWSALGLLALLAQLLQERGLARLALSGRMLADLQQCAELLQERIHAEGLGPAASADWLRRLRLEPDRLVSEAHQPHSDVEDAAVAVVTVHRSKGLEYPVVICPYLWQAPAAAAAQQGPGVRWQPADGPDPQLDLHLSQQWGAGLRAWRQHQRAELAERERLAYVALTRACQLLVLAWGPAAGQEGNPLHAWLIEAGVPGGEGSGTYADGSDADWWERLQQQIARRQLPLQLLQPLAAAMAPPHPQPLPPAAMPPPTPAPLELGPVPRRRLDDGWGRSSYTSWTRGSHGAAPEALEEGRETDGLVANLVLGAAAQASPGGWPAEGPLGQFPRGANAGDCLHRILEQLDFQRPLGDQPALLERELVRAGIALTHLEPLQSGLERLRSTPFGGALGPFCLAELAATHRLHEMAFDLPLALVRAEGLARAFGPGYGTSLAALPIASRGFLTGSIDLVFEHLGRWWVLDWKSNWLGERDAGGQPLRCGPLHYSAAAMDALMQANHYPLQAHLYLVALHRYLRWRLPGYDPRQHLGGSVYVFLRGVTGPIAAAPLPTTVPGICIDQPPLERLLAIDALLETGRC